MILKMTNEEPIKYDDRIIYIEDKTHPDGYRLYTEADAEIRRMKQQKLIEEWKTKND